MKDVGQTFGGGESGGSGGSGPSAAEIISGGASAFGILADLQRSRIQADALEGQAQQRDVNARVERANADMTANVIRQRLNDTLANNNAALSVSGVDATSGSARVVQQQSRSAANRAFFQTDTNARIRVAALKREATQLREAAKEERKAGARRAKLGLFSTWLKGASMGAA